MISALVTFAFGYKIFFGFEMVNALPSMEVCIFSPGIRKISYAKYENIEGESSIIKLLSAGQGKYFFITLLCLNNFTIPQTITMKKVRFLFILLASFYCSIYSVQAQKIYVLNRLGHNVTLLDISKEGVKSDEFKLPNNLPNPISFQYYQALSELLILDQTSSNVTSFTQELDESFSLDLKGPKSVVDVCLDVDKNDIYWINRTEKTINKRSLSNPEVLDKLDSSSINPAHMVISNKEQLLFWTDLKEGIYRYSIEEKKKNKIFNSQDQSPLKLYIDEEEKLLYFSDDVNGQIHRMNFDGKYKELIYQGKSGEAPYAMLRINNYLFWTDYLQGNVKRMNLDSKEFEVVFEGLKEPLDISLTNVSKSISLRRSERLSLIVSPNPSNGEVKVVLNGTDCPNSNVYIYDSTNKLVKEFRLDGFEKLVQLTSLKSGLYFCKTLCQDQILINSFILIE